MVRHVLRNSLIPVITLWGLDFGAVVGGGAILTETVFDLQGVGQYAAEAVGQLDVPPVLAVTLFGAFFIVLLNAIVDIVYAYLDPRIRLQ
jgi:peptide/nickel transport system permease protein